MDFLGRVGTYLTTSSHWWGTEGFVHRIEEHVQLSVIALLIAMAIALPLGLVLGHTGRGGFVAINFSNLGRAIPSFAIIVLAAQVWGIGNRPGMIALVALAVPPMVTNTYVAIAGVDEDVKEAARGMGLSGPQVLTRVELPMAVPLIMAGVRTSGVQVVATTSLIALTGGGALGRYIIDGLATRDFVVVFAGALLVALLSVVAEVLLGLLQRALVPAGLTAGESSGSTEIDLSARPGAAVLAGEQVAL